LPIAPLAPATQMLMERIKPYGFRREHGEPGDDAASGLASTFMAGCTRMAGFLRV
jgi:hypothetical protein